MSRIDLATPGHYLETWHRYASPDERIGGYVEHHPDKRDPSKDCSGSITLRTDANPDEHPSWRLVAGTPEAPLTLEPSILCRTCGAHGWIRDGAWTEA